MKIKEQQQKAIEANQQQVLERTRLTSAVSSFMGELFCHIEKHPHVEHVNLTEDKNLLRHNLGVLNRQLQNDEAVEVELAVTAFRIRYRHESPTGQFQADIKARLVDKMERGYTGWDLIANKFKYRDILSTHIKRLSPFASSTGQDFRQITDVAALAMFLHMIRMQEELCMPSGAGGTSCQR